MCEITVIFKSIDLNKLSAYYFDMQLQNLNGREDDIEAFRKGVEFGLSSFIEDVIKFRREGSLSQYLSQFEKQN